MNTSSPDEAARHFAEYHTCNPDVWKWFEKFAFDRMHRGYTRYGAMAILNRIRWEISAARNHEGVAVQNTWAPFYARLFHACHPKHRGFFETRPSVADDCMDYIQRIADVMGSSRRSGREV